MKPTFLIKLLIGLFPLLFMGCGDSNQNSDGKRSVVCTTSIIADAVRHVAGDHVHVASLMGPGIDPHRYTASPGDIRKLTSAAIVFHHGLHLEGKLSDVLEQPRAGQKSVIVTGRIPEDKLLAGDGGDGPHDPHVWFDPKLWVEILPPIVEALSELDPQHKADFETNAKTYRDAILVLDRELEAQVKTIPEQRRKLVTSHDAFRYLGARYGIEVHGLLGISTSSEASTKDVSRLAEFLAQHRVPAIFGETSVPSKGLQAVMDACRQKYHTVELVGGENALYSDALGGPGSPGEDYLGMIRHNITTIATTLSKSP